MCNWYGYCKSGYYKHRKIAQKRREEEEMILLHMQAIRKSGVMCGCRKMKIYLEKFFNCTIGRDRLFRIMEKHNMQCRYYRRRTVTSTGKRSAYPYLIKDIKIDTFGQVIASDITYIRLPRNKFCYVTVVSDLKTRMILCYNISDTLMLEGALKALKMAVRNYGRYFNDQIIHHSDHGVQYTSNEYTAYLQSQSIKISMTGRGKCYDNAQAERIFNTLKHEYAFSKTFSSIKEVKRELKMFIKSYNTIRIHESLGYKTPYEVFDEIKNAA